MPRCGRSRLQSDPWAPARPTESRLRVESVAVARLAASGPPPRERHGIDLLDEVGERAPHVIDGVAAFGGSQPALAVRQPHRERQSGDGHSEHGGERLPPPWADGTTSGDVRGEQLAGDRRVDLVHGRAVASGLAPEHHGGVDGLVPGDVRARVVPVHSQELAHRCGEDVVTMEVAV
jgi:hypothetical protein